MEMSGLRARPLAIHIGVPMRRRCADHRDQRHVVACRVSAPVGDLQRDRPLPNMHSLHEVRDAPGDDVIARAEEGGE
jgi:hypothetical protein